VIDLQMRPKLAAKVRLRRDALSGRHLLLYPERGMSLNATGVAIVELCDGEATVSDIVATLVRRYATTPSDVVEAEVLAFLGALRDRALLAGAAAAPAGSEPTAAASGPSAGVDPDGRR
jgi:pyrroloquinoline quinone biosynthesis protein D